MTILLFSCGCVISVSNEEKRSLYIYDKLDQPLEKDIVEPQDFKNGVYYFPATKQAFAGSLSNFLQKHPELLLISMTGNGDNTHGHDKGYFCYFKKI